MKLVFALVATAGIFGAVAARAEQGPPSMSSAQAADYAACLKQANKNAPDWNNNQVTFKYFVVDECAKAKHAVGTGQ